MEVLKNWYVYYLPTNVDFILLEDSFSISWPEDDPEGKSKRVVLLLRLEYDRWGVDVTWQFLIRYNNCQHTAGYLIPTRNNNNNIIKMNLWDKYGTE
jgi:hypothetical protein